MARKNCAARQYSDQMSCHECGLTWDMNDPEPPVCGRDPVEQNRRRGQKHLQTIRKLLGLEKRSAS